MANRWETKERVADFFLGSKITADGDYSHEIKRCLLLGRKAVTNLDSVLKSRDIIFLTKVCIVKALIFPVVIYRCESWNIQKDEHWIIDAFKLWCWRRLLRVPWTAGRSNQSLLKEINPEYSLEGLMPKLKLQYFGHWCEESTHWKRPRCWERWKAWREGDGNRWDAWMASLTQWTWVWANYRRWWRTGRPGMLLFMGSQRVRSNWVTEQHAWCCMRIGYQPTPSLDMSLVLCLVTRNLNCPKCCISIWDGFKSSWPLLGIMLASIQMLFLLD